MSDLFFLLPPRLRPYTIQDFLRFAARILIYLGWIWKGLILLLLLLGLPGDVLGEAGGEAVVAGGQVLVMLLHNVKQHNVNVT
jgi:hypothetical protein